VIKRPLLLLLLGLQLLDGCAEERKVVVTDGTATPQPPPKDGMARDLSKKIDAEAKSDGLTVDMSHLSDTSQAAPLVGRKCTTDASCGKGYMCFTEAPGGYCMPGAPGGPTACTPNQSTCPLGTRCSPLPGHQIAGVCLRPCKSHDDCSSPQVCNDVYLYPGETTGPHSEGRVCWFACMPKSGAQNCNDNPLISSIHGSCAADGTCVCNGSFPKNPQSGRCL
jgi:hypothetical protein